MNENNNTRRKKDDDLPIGNHLGTQLLSEEDKNIGECLTNEVNHAENIKMKNKQIELARQSGYNEACYVKDKKFKEFTEKLKRSFRNKDGLPMHSFDTYQIEDKINNLYKEYSKGEENEKNIK